MYVSISVVKTLNKNTKNKTIHNPTDTAAATVFVANVLYLFLFSV